ncbi:MAG: tRNA uridine-5-carboxymethylaminomethyl(34) synthesis GTPase MnmE [Acidobacteria bacterium]|nr:tRNA uridine-5-carboxymethylaminomethyl(34) synthesis GTPase MnmE [Acidobacteriota bacterium]
MFATGDSIVAVATPPGRGGIGIVRISGPSSLEIAQAVLEHPRRLRARYATYTRVRQADRERPSRPGRAIDEVIATYFPAPHSYTGEHVVEISAHGSPVVLQAIVSVAMAAGARLAEPGEFTLRAFLSGKRDLIQAEAVADLIAAVTPLQARVAFDQLEGTLTERIREIDGQLFDLIARLEASLDFPDEGYHFIEPQETARQTTCLVEQLDRLLAGARRGRLIREGATVVVAGRPNVGKSSLFNALVGADRAIVTDIAGTTRDLVSEHVDLDGLAVTMVDTAGWREAADVVEREGVRRAARARAAADLLMVVLDRSEPMTVEDGQLLADTAAARRLVVLNKADLPASHSCSGAAVCVSARTGEGIDELRRAIARELTGSDAWRDTAAISNTRHIALLEQARDSLSAAARAAAENRAPEEFVLADLQAARVHFDEVVGARTTEDVLQHIFERFCVGK